MGLLDALSSDDAKLGIALLSASGYSPTPMSFGQRLGGALGQFNAERTDSAQRALKTKLLQSQIDENASQNMLRQGQLERANALAAAPNALFGWGGGASAQGGGAPGAVPANMGGGIQPGSLKGVPLAAVTRYKMMGGQDLTKQWELENIGTAQQPGWVVRADGSREFLGDPSKGISVGPDGVTRPMAGAPEALAEVSRLQERAKAEEGARFQEGTPTINPDGSKSVRSRLEMFGGAASADPYINAIIKTESNGNPNAVSPKGAQGLMQVMPGTNSSPGFGVAPARDLSEAERTRVGQDYWKAMNERYQNPTLAAIAYNWGPGNTDLWLKAGGDFSKLPAETKSYVAQVMTRGAVNSRQPAASNVVELSPAQQAQNKADEIKLVEGAKADVVRDTDRQKDSKLQGRISGVAQQAMRLLEANPTGSGAGALADSALNFIGQPTKAGNVAQSLEAVAGWMVANVPRMEGPQSNIDVINYQTMAGRVGDRSLPAETRKAALREVIALQNKYAELNGSTPQETKPSGLPSGWSVKVK